MPRLIDLTGRRFARLLVLERWPQNDPGGKPMWVCACDCGAKKPIGAYLLVSGKTRSCGCLHQEMRADVMRRTMTRHGRARTPEWYSWMGMRSRCNNPNATGYERYGGRGIKICKRWDCFENFYADMGKRPSQQHTLERRDVNGDYTPKNTYWATKTQQANNRRDTPFVIYHGERMSVRDAMRKSGTKLNGSTVARRLRKGWSYNDVFDTPAKR